jgi:hypothetical protein
MADDQKTDQHSEEEAQRRFEALIRAALNTPPKPLKDIPRTRPYRPRKRKPGAEPVRQKTAMP